MTKSDFRIIFLGTPEFAVSSLRKLVEENWNVVAVITAPDKASGRGLNVTSSPVKRYAVDQGLKVLQPSNLKDPEFLENLREYNAQLQVVVAFRMLPKEVWNMPPLGTFNLHASLLPNYRGAAPIQWAIINGEVETGVTTFFLKHEIDEGKIILQRKEEILPQDTAGSLHNRLMASGAVLVNRTAELIFDGHFESHEQILSGNEKSAPKITPEVCQINWNLSSNDIHNLIRGLSPYPCARTVIGNIQFKIYQSEIIKGKGPEEGGKIVSDNKTFLHMTTNDGIISILEIQKEGKKRMSIKEFLAGNKI